MPAGATNTKVSWSSSDESVLKIENGVVTVISAGKAKVTATAANGVCGEIEIDVFRAAEQLVCSIDEVQMCTGEEYKIEAPIYATNATQSVSTEPASGDTETVYFDIEDYPAGRDYDVKIFLFDAYDAYTVTPYAKNSPGLTGSLGEFHRYCGTS